MENTNDARPDRYTDTPDGPGSRCAPAHNHPGPQPPDHGRLPELQGDGKAVRDRRDRKPEGLRRVPGVQRGRKDRGDWRATCAAAHARNRERNIEERIAWAFSPISRGVFPKTENATRFASLPKELHPIAWAKFHEFADRARRTGKMSKGWIAR